MSRITFPKAKYGVYIAIIIVVVVLVIILQRFNFINNLFHDKKFSINCETKKN